MMGLLLASGNLSDALRYFEYGAEQLLAGSLAMLNIATSVSGVDEQCRMKLFGVKAWLA
jgi:hypothetical protein